MKRLFRLSLGVYNLTENHDHRRMAFERHVERQKGKLADRVRQLRKARGLRQEDLEDYGISVKAYQQIEYGAPDVRFSTLIKLARAFEITLPELLTFENTKDTSK